jgi:hypothetical protein
VPIVVQLASPLTVQEGDNVTVNLNYDPSSVDCSNGTSIADMFRDMTATVTIN